MTPGKESDSDLTAFHVTQTKQKVFCGWKQTLAASGEQKGDCNTEHIKPQIQKARDDSSVWCSYPAFTGDQPTIKHKFNNWSFYRCKISHSSTSVLDQISKNQSMRGAAHWCNITHRGAWVCNSCVEFAYSLLFLWLDFYPAVQKHGWLDNWLVQTDHWCQCKHDH